MRQETSAQFAEYVACQQFNKPSLLQLFYVGKEIWRAEHDSVLKASWNTYRAAALPDWDNDGLRDVLIANGGDPALEPQVISYFVSSGSTTVYV